MIILGFPKASGAVCRSQFHLAFQTQMTPCNHDSGAREQGSAGVSIPGTPRERFTAGTLHLSGAAEEAQPGLGNRPTEERRSQRRTGAGPAPYSSLLSSTIQREK
jgi:hypothetical protein